jgi:hypothetical protein
MNDKEWIEFTGYVKAKLEENEKAHQRIEDNLANHLKHHEKVKSKLSDNLFKIIMIVLVFILGIIQFAILRLLGLR